MSTASRSALAVLVLAAAAVTGYLSLRGEPTSGRASLDPLAVDPGVVHVHGLGVDPADGALYAATHTGLFRLPDSGTAVRIAGRAQDTMGFAVVGPRHFIGSGHPDPREDDVRPPLLGLVESTDAGQTWERRSLHGQADFHVLRRAHGLTYGYDSTSGTLLVSADGVRWNRRGRVPLHDFAVSPSDPTSLVAVTERGVMNSRDGGRTFEPITAPGRLALLSWTARGLFGVGSDGGVHLRDGRSGSWRRLGTLPAPPEAFVVDVREGRETLYVATADEILMSTDGGSSFTTRYRGRPHPAGPEPS